MAWNNKKGQCYYSYYIMFVHPTRDGKALVSTCSNNFFRKENRVIVGKGIAEAWNAPQFQFQRKLLSQKSWQACWGAECAYRPALFDARNTADPRVLQDIRAGNVRLAYLPKVLYLVPTMVCNQSCYYCYCFRGKRSKQCQSAQLNPALLTEIEEEILPAVDMVVLSGGEPFFSEIGQRVVRTMIEKYPQKKLCVFTNGVFLDRFGLKSIVDRNISLRISLCGMSSASYMKVCGCDNFARVHDNIKALLLMGIKRLELSFIISRESCSEVDEFCKLVEANAGIWHALIEPNYYESKMFYRQMRFYEQKYAHLSSRVDFDYRNKSTIGRVLRSLYNPLLSLHYSLWKLQSRPGMKNNRSACHEIR